jgi:hypothetical protein
MSNLCFIHNRQFASSTTATGASLTSGAWLTFEEFRLILQKQTYKMLKYPEKLGIFFLV